MESTQRISMLFSLAIIFWSALITADGFSITHPTAATKSFNNHNNIPLLRNTRNNQSQSASFTSRSTFSSILLHLSTTNDSSNDDETDKKKKGDSIRSKTGIRPSLHPTEINCIAEALMLRSTNNPSISIDASNPNVEPLEVAITAGGIAMTAIDKRNSDKDDTSEKFTMEESQAISGRVVGVVMRMNELENLLVERVQGVGWVKKYGEEASFGVLRAECDSSGSDNDGGGSKKEELEKQVGEMIKINPLFRMNRAECLLCLFLDTVERPKLELLGEGVAGGSEIDFIDADRLEVLRTATKKE
mmetsp:Transcript_15574/g.24162  ORF Transcript_15574/g.24162 Transcript_15574/m.24162 type:complete len:303 (+) Transcript_15574:140-1048(+)|eukprot:CAMPEP_0201732816 /NCGR_PEP_ID=MMETSP0593-20130828/29880_1 /ASSEMBLY_ACC=CAM_ASM_000672 /TAXON_ID=267983 /ORGANISM="Skeletonema japonicum, Strain CCMP2506" /LENGTH=302 /DNA_ID=CAMNT_0048225853 /DNA_START=124 /DNA_END=1032 /DNA_ORIENTATION=-